MSLFDVKLSWAFPHQRFVMHESTHIPCDRQSLQLAYQYAAAKVRRTVLPSVSYILLLCRRIWTHGQRTGSWA